MKSLLDKWAQRRMSKRLFEAQDQGQIGIRLCNEAHKGMFASTGIWPSFFIKRES